MVKVYVFLMEDPLFYRPVRFNVYPQEFQRLKIQSAILENLFTVPKNKSLKFLSLENYGSYSVTSIVYNNSL